MQSDAQPLNPTLPWLAPGQAFPPAHHAWGADSAAPGLLAAGGALDVSTLRRAYEGGLFPWYSAGQPILWWSPDPRMVLEVAHFRLHQSFRKTLRKFCLSTRCSVRIDSAFDQVIAACASSARPGQRGTWIVPEMLHAYGALHRAGLAHSVETWIDGTLVGGLYCVGIGRAVFGESMFSAQPNSSKIALAALVAFCRLQGITHIDCQQNTAHLAALGAAEVPRVRFLQHLRSACTLPGPAWAFDSMSWQLLLQK